MKLKTLISLAMMPFAWLLVSFPLAGQEGNNLSSAPSNIHYVVKDLGTLGGTGSVAEGISDRGWVVGSANLGGDTNGHAFLWRDGVMTDLGTLGGANSQVQWPVKDNRGLIVGDAETSTQDPNNEDFCGFDANSGLPPTGDICVGFIWQDGVMRALPTLGGNNGRAIGTNNLGQVVGMTEASTSKMGCSPPQLLDVEAVIWGPGVGQVKTLTPLPGDVSAMATGINDRQQVVGVSGKCTSPNFNLTGTQPPQHGVIWQNGTVTNLGSLGGTLLSFPFAINATGQVVGQSYIAGDVYVHPFLWEKGAIKDLGVLPGDLVGSAFGLNNEGEVVGGSCDANFICRAFLWQKGKMIDVNSLVQTGSTPLHLFFGNDINDLGEIAAYAYDQDNGQFHAALAIPCEDDISVCADGISVTAVATGAAPATSTSPEVQPRMKFGRGIRRVELGR